ncbi:hypothetical protein ABEY57_20865 [Bacillus tropicus]|uniref:Uncharacterized protein n=1 Tax=Bacillus thuringiensis subsp. medellin TaxID=79672 RepID=A0A9X6R7X1_BACTV|nr:hypothetical protein [Bacillus thuringiensis]OUB82077.1 hypothetical protein BK784_39095 [Bacillus thuringiensis serovar medellin]
MAMRTAFRGKVIIKEEYKELVKLINLGEWETAIMKYPFLQDYYVVESSPLIPLPKSVIQSRLNEGKDSSEKGWLRLEVDVFNWSMESEYYTDLRGLEWTFITCLKNYPNKNHDNKRPIETFIDVVLSKVVSKIIKIQLYDEEWLDSQVQPLEYKFQKTKILTEDFKKAVVNKIVAKR